MKFSFECEIESDDVFDIIDTLDHIKEGIDGGSWCGGYDCSYADYSWSLHENDDEDEECWGDEDDEDGDDDSED